MNPAWLCRHDAEPGIHVPPVSKVPVRGGPVLRRGLFCAPPPGSLQPRGSSLCGAAVAPDSSWVRILPVPLLARLSPAKSPKLGLLLLVSAQMGRRRADMCAWMCEPQGDTEGTGAPPNIWAKGTKRGCPGPQTQVLGRPCRSRALPYALQTGLNPGLSQAGPEFPGDVDREQEPTRAHRMAPTAEAAGGPPG